MAKPRRPPPVLDEATRRFCEEKTVELLPLIQRIAVRSKLPFPLEDLVQEGAKAAFEGLSRFDPARGVKLESWITWRIHGAMKDYARNFRFFGGNGRREHPHLTSLDKTAFCDDSGDEVTWHDLTPAPATRPQCDWNRLLRGFDKRERIILIGYFVLGRTMKQIGEELDLGESRVSQWMTLMLDRFRELEASERRVSSCMA